MVSAPDAAFREFVVATQPRLLAFAELVTADRGRAEDLLQEAYLAAFAAWPRIHDQAPDAYVRRCVVNGRISWWRRRSSHERPTDHTDVLPREVTSGDTDAVDERLLLLAALRRLTTRERTVVALRFLNTPPWSAGSPSSPRRWSAPCLWCSRQGRGRASR